MHCWHPGNVTGGAKPLCQRVLRGQPRPELTRRGGPGTEQCRAPVLRRNVPEAQRQLPIRRRVLLEQQVPAPPKKEGGRQRGKEELNLLGEAGPLPPLSWEPAAEPLQTSEPSRSGAARSRAWGNRSVPFRSALRCPPCRRAHGGCAHRSAPLPRSVRPWAGGRGGGTMRSAPAAGLLPLLLGLRLLLGGGAEAQYSSDLCNWKGSGLTHESHKKDVEQVYLRCSEGSIEWMYPTGALIVNLRPNTSPASYKHLTVCIKPFKDSAGANIYLEKTGELKLLVRDGERGPSKVYCFGYDQGGLFVEATPQQDISRKITGFQYELMSRGIASDLHTVSAPCRPCSDTEVLLAICTSDFVIRGSIQDVTNEAEEQESIIHVGINKLYRQKSKVFQLTGESGNWRGQIKTLLECGVRPGDGDFLFTGRMHFGEARLGCAPRFKDFQRMYKEAKDKGLNPCEIGPD